MGQQLCIAFVIPQVFFLKVASEQVTLVTQLSFDIKLGLIPLILLSIDYHRGIILRNFIPLSVIKWNSTLSSHNITSYCDPTMHCQIDYPIDSSDDVVIHLGLYAKLMGETRLG